MPGFNGTGPQGMGPMTGGARGFCSPKIRVFSRRDWMPGSWFGMSDRGMGAGMGIGRCGGRGMGRGMGMGRGIITTDGRYPGPDKKDENK